jgi:hypothetical protein
MKDAEDIDTLGPIGNLPAAAESTTIMAGRRTQSICRKNAHYGIRIAIGREGFLWSESAREIP